MMKRSLVCLLVCVVARAGAQNNIAGILNSVETHNVELKAAAQVVLSQKAAVSSQNSLEDPSFDFSHLWGTESAKDRKYDIGVSQAFDFPSVYVQRNKVGNLKRSLYDTQQAVLRQQILLQAKELCLQIVYLNRHIRLAEQRRDAADELARLYRDRLESGDASVLDVNKIEIEQMNVVTNCTRLYNERAACVSQLQVLNGGNPFVGVESMLTDYTDEELPASFDEWKAQALQADPELQQLRQENRVVDQSVSLSRSGWLPRFALGYRHVYELGERFNGLSVGVSIPIFANRKRVKAARAQAVAGGFSVDNRELQAGERLLTTYNEAVSLKENYERYTELTRRNHLELLEKALLAGRISMIEYLVDVTQFYDAFENQLSLEYEYRLRLARLYKYTL